MSRANYKILDEPSPGLLGLFVVHPFWPLLGVMLAGVWFGWPWFLFNSLAMGSPTRLREIMWIGVHLVVAIVLFFVILLVLAFTPLPIQYAMLSLEFWKLAVGYVLFLQQASTLEIYRHFGGTVRNGLLPLLFVLSATFMHYTVLGGRHCGGNETCAALWLIFVH